MSPATYKLHVALIRYVKGILSAWETWLKEVAPPKIDPDPVEHFSHKK